MLNSPGRFDKPHEIDRGIVFLCETASDDMTESSLLIDGEIELPVREMHRLESPVGSGAETKQHSQLPRVA